MQAVENSYFFPDSTLGFSMRLSMALRIFFNSVKLKLIPMWGISVSWQNRDSPPLITPWDKF